jgi:hypothetical protein
MEAIQKYFAGLMTGPLHGGYFMWNLFMLMPFFGMVTNPDWNHDWLFWAVLLFTIGLWTIGILAFIEEFYHHENALIRIPVQTWAYALRFLTLIFVVLAISGAMNKDGD